jgi:inner membrane protein
MSFGSGALVKGVMVALVALLVLIPVQLLRSLVAERSQLREEAVTRVARGWGGKQLLGGAILAIPTTVTRDDGRTAVVDWYVLPETLTLESELTVQDERRKLGVYEVPVYVTTVHAVATFDIASKVASLMQGPRASTLHLDRARLLVPVADTRGVRDVKVTGAAVANGAFEPDRSFIMGALATALRPDAQIDKGEHRFDLTMQIAGTYSLAFMPTAHSTSLQLAGNWPDPGFTRGFLPMERTVGEGRFSARWQILDLNRSFGSNWLSDQLTGEVLQESAFGVDLVQPVDLYQRAERSVKYAGLFIALSLLTLFVWEHLARRPLHPIQYGLMGLALSVFYLLLLALAEHIGFTLAYVVAAAALCALLGIYLSGVFDSARSGSGASAVFAGVYALLYLLVTSEDYSLLAGSLAVFALLATAMVLTRRLDWYQATGRTKET